MEIDSAGEIIVEPRCPEGEEGAPFCSLSELLNLFRSLRALHIRYGRSSWCPQTLKQEAVMHTLTLAPREAKKFGGNLCVEELSFGNIDLSFSLFQTPHNSPFISPKPVSVTKDYRIGRCVPLKVHLSHRLTVMFSLFIPRSILNSVLYTSKSPVDIPSSPRSNICSTRSVMPPFFSVSWKCTSTFGQTGTLAAFT